MEIFDDRLIPAFSVFYGDTITNNAGGTIRGGSSAFAIQTGGGNDLLTNRGAIIGTLGNALDLGDGDDTLRVVGGLTTEDPIIVARGDDPRLLAREGLVGLGFSAQEAERIMGGFEGIPAGALPSIALFFTMHEDRAYLSWLDEPVGAKLVRHARPSFVAVTPELLNEAIARVAAAFAPDIVIASDTPLFPLNSLRRLARRRSAAFVFWMMDVYGLAVRAGLARHLG